MRTKPSNHLIYFCFLGLPYIALDDGSVSHHWPGVATKKAMPVVKMTIWQKIKSALNFGDKIQIAIANTKQICTVDWTTWSPHGETS
jgi:hypothetical protein